ncbi:alkaline phosphatase family protein [Bradyrhizobium erythrophlei]|uniref:Phospholipase C n=1 Tax=Bradyrhizobium erythrophlei TaxID=1437360 RepID=A0A1M5QV20_9BRAD|nr:alkaline phosphatase family protein [Bradyrhizobium erythrophlei]SHH17549.1 phospholipase C [Bradyrhizobium erythrophlei]
MLKTALARRFGLLGVSLATLALSPGVRAEDANNQIKTASPIKHVIIIVGENRSFDHLFATYVPKSREERVLNLLSEHIVKADGTPDEKFDRAHQFQVTSAPNGASFFISAGSANKSLYSKLPAPDLGGVQAPTGLPILSIPGGDPGLPAADQFLFGTGGTGLPVSVGPDTRITNVNNLPPGPFQLTGPTMPYDAYTADTIHQFFQMYQQMDCAIDKEHVSRGNPTGCLHDLQSFVTTTYSTAPGGTPHDTGQTMAFFNMQKNDVPYLKFLADEYTMSDNYHQPVMGGTGPDSVPLGFADQVFFSDGNGHAVTPPASSIYNPDPLPNTLNQYTVRKQWFNCSDQTQHGIKPILDYLGKLPYPVQTKCDPGAYYNAVNVNPAWTPQGTPSGAGSIPPVTMTSIGDLLSAKHIPWKYYGGAYNVSGTGAPLDGIYCNICNPFEYQVNYPAMRADHMRDVTDLFNDLKNGTLPAVSYAKPDGAMDGHPASSKFDLFEEFTKNIIQLAQSNKEQWESTAIFVTVDEGGGFYDSGFIQPVDFFGTGPRIPMIAVSPFSRGGHITHVYGEHSSFVKFVERNWYLGKLSERSRDNLPNPRAEDENPYVPVNMPAIGDLFDMFDFDRGHDHDRDGGGDRH